jgi:hypothetical protein
MMNKEDCKLSNKETSRLFAGVLAEYYIRMMEEYDKGGWQNIIYGWWRRNAEYWIVGWKKIDRWGTGQNFGEENDGNILDKRGGGILNRKRRILDRRIEKYWIGECQNTG